LASEVAVPRPGELRVEDLTAVYGAGLREMDHVDVLVLAVDGGAPVVGRVQLVNVPSGHGMHGALVCAACEKSTRLLVARAGTLRCRACVGLRTNHQRLRSLADWRRRGGREADRLLRLLAHPTRHVTPAKVAEARQLLREIIDADHARMALLKEDLAALEVCVKVAEASP
jgi:hypothetical protein